MGETFLPLKENLQKKKRVVIFGGSIARSIRLCEFNYRLYKSFAQFKSFSGGTSKEHLYYVESILKDKKYPPDFTSCWS